MKAFDKDGVEIEVFSAEEHQAGVTAEVTKIKGEYEPKIEILTTELTGAKTALGERAGEFAQFRKLNAETVAKLSVAERTIYENGLVLHEEREKNKIAEKARYDAQVDSALRAKAGTDEKLFTKMKEMWSIIGVEAVTPEAIENKTKMILGAIGTTEPDLLASVAGFNGGSFAPPKPPQKEGESFADSERGKAGMAELGLKLPEEKK